MGWGWRSDESPNVSSTYQLSLTRTRIILHIFKTFDRIYLFQTVEVFQHCFCIDS